MILMLEGMLVVSISQQLLNMAKVSLHSKVKLDYHLTIHVYIWCIVFTDIHMGTSRDIFIYFLLFEAGSHQMAGGHFWSTLILIH